MISEPFWDLVKRVISPPTARHLKINLGSFDLDLPQS